MPQTKASKLNFFNKEQQKKIPNKLKQKILLGGDCSTFDSFSKTAKAFTMKKAFGEISKTALKNRFSFSLIRNHGIKASGYVQKFIPTCFRNKQQRRRKKQKLFFQWRKALKNAQAENEKAAS